MDFGYFLVILIKMTLQAWEYIKNIGEKRYRMRNKYQTISRSEDLDFQKICKILTFESLDEENFVIYPLEKILVIQNSEVVFSSTDSIHSVINHEIGQNEVNFNYSNTVLPDILVPEALQLNHVSFTDSFKISFSKCANDSNSGNEYNEKLEQQSCSSSTSDKKTSSSVLENQLIDFIVTINKKKLAEKNIDTNCGCKTEVLTSREQIANSFSCIQICNELFAETSQKPLAKDDDRRTEKKMLVKERLVESESFHDGNYRDVEHAYKVKDIYEDALLLPQEDNPSDKNDSSSDYQSDFESYSEHSDEEFRMPFETEIPIIPKKCGFALTRSRGVLTLPPLELKGIPLELSDDDDYSHNFRRKEIILENVKIYQLTAEKLEKPINSLLKLSIFKNLSTRTDLIEDSAVQSYYHSMILSQLEDSLPFALSGSLGHF
eukprot:NODE_401_length_8090_cov_0.333876.p4 type:complete len:434 gc:universal NODE_401_length_8090_cov_0.333876:5927-4626(-)